MIYMDHHAASPILPQVAAGMEAVRSRAWANPSSQHTAGRYSASLLETARRRVAACVGASPADVVFTSGGTESCNLALRGLIQPGSVVVTSGLEHPAINETLREIGDVDIRTLPIEVSHLQSPQGVASLISERPTWLVLASVNHETGTLLPIDEYAKAFAAKGGRVFVDATQAFGKTAVSFRDVDALALASHKIGGPAGCGALVVNRTLPLRVLSTGGMQERGRRAGTPDVVGAHGFGIACLAVPERLSEMKRIASLRDQLEVSLAEAGGTQNVPSLPRVATVANASFRGWRGDILVAALDVEGLCASSGAACSSGKSEPSPVLSALYPDEPWRATSALRLSLGPTNTASEVTQAGMLLRRVLSRTQGV